MASGVFSMSYARRRGDYIYDIEIDEAARGADTGSFCARVVNVVRLGATRPCRIHLDLPCEYGATRDEAFARIEAALGVTHHALIRSSCWTYGRITYSGQQVTT
jgi:hypothetical protein